MGLYVLVEKCLLDILKINPGDDEAMASLGAMYLKGLGVQRDEDKARSIFMQARESGIAEASFHLGCMYRDSLGVKQDFGLAQAYFFEADEAGHVHASLSLGIMQEHGLGMEPDVGKARELFERAFQSAHHNQAKGGARTWGKRTTWVRGRAAAHLGIMHCRGKGAEEDFGKAVELFEEAVCCGQTDALSYLAAMYATGRGVGQDWGKALELLEDACDAGSLHAACALAVIHSEGLCGERSVDKAQAFLRRVQQARVSAGRAVAYLREVVGNLDSMGQGLVDKWQLLELPGLAPTGSYLD